MNSFNQALDMTSVADSTDPGTRRPVEPSFSQSGVSFEPLYYLKRFQILNPEVIILAKSPLALWQLFFSSEQIYILMTNTNSNARLFYAENPHQSEHARPWNDTTTHELYAFFAIHIYMGIHKEPHITNYWNTQLSRPVHLCVIKAMLCNRFQIINQFFHISNPAESGDTFSKLEPLNKHLLHTAKVRWQPGRDVAIDECMQRF